MFRQRLIALQCGNETDYLELFSFKSKTTQDPYHVLTSWNHCFHFCEWSGISCGKRHKRVTVLWLDSQGLEGSLSSHVGNLSFLRVLSLSNNTFQGTIPHELGRLSRLRRLNLGANKFGGFIPTNLSGCSNLELLSLGGNKLAGSIPKEMSLLSKLSFLSIQNNKLTGGIPPFLGNITSMEVFSCIENPLGGSIPDNLGLWKSLTTFYSGGCNLYGSIPHSIFNLSLLVNFSSSENHLTGSLPSEIGNQLPNLEWLQLSENELTGVLPPSLSNCSKLGLLDMGYNNFSGKLTIDFSKVRGINITHLDNNKLNGREEVDDMRSASDIYSLEMMPFGLLKCTVTWFSSHISDDEAKSILHSIKQGGLVVIKSLSSLLYEWVRISYSGKTSVEKFRLELHVAFENRCSFLSEQIKKGVSTSSSSFNSSSMYDTSYSSGINFHVLFPQRLDMSTHLSTYPTENNTESRPEDHIIFFHKALKKDMEKVISISANLAISELYYSGSSQGMLMYRQLCAKLHNMCKGMNKMLSDHMAHEEIDLWPLFTEHLSLKECDKFFYTYKCGNSYHVVESEKSTISTQSALDTLEIVLKYLPRERSGRENQETSHKMMHYETTNDDEQKRKKSKMTKLIQKGNSEAYIIRVNGDDDLKPQQKSMIIQNLMMSRWINTQKKSDPDVDELGFLEVKESSSLQLVSMLMYIDADVDESCANADVFDDNVC
ncbi:kinase-like domain-containing protein [Tanacetum coccineum]